MASSRCGRKAEKPEAGLEPFAQQAPRFLDEGPEVPLPGHDDAASEADRARDLTVALPALISRPLANVSLPALFPAPTAAAKSIMTGPPKVPLPPRMAPVATLTLPVLVPLPACGPGATSQTR